ncbi:MAG: hypothetical protein AAGF23_22750 [Acidobacteriota bacterium]
MLDARLMATQCLRPLCLAGTPATTRVENTSLSQAEGNSGSALLAFTVTRTGDTAFGASVDYQFVPFGEFGVDVEDAGGTLTSGTLNFLPGGSQRQVALSIMGDTVYEPTEGLALELSNARGTALENHAAAAIVENDDPIGAFTASGQGSFSSNCVSVPDETVPTALRGEMAQFGFTTPQGFNLQTFEGFGGSWDAGYHSRPSTLLGSSFGKNQDIARILEGESIFFLPACAPPSQFPWSIDLQIEGVVFNANPSGPPDAILGPLLRASVGEATINRDNVKSVGGEFVIGITGDQLTYGEFEQAAMAAGYDPAMLNLLRVPDIQVPDGEGLGGLTDLFSGKTTDFPLPLLGITWNIHHAGYGTSHAENLVPRSSRVFVREAERPRQPFPLEDVNPTSANHESLVDKHSQDFDDLVSAVIAYFETERGLLFLSDQSLTSENALESNAGIGAFTFEGGQACIDAELDCGFNSSDTLYAWPGDSSFLDDDDYYVLVGLDYTLLDQMGGPMASQAIVGVHFVTEDPSGGDNVYLGDGFEIHAARRELPLRALPNWTGDGLSSVVTENSFLFQIVTEANCPVGLESAALCVSDLFGEPIAFISQLMLNPVTGTRPDPDQVIPWRLLRFEIP